MGTLTFAVVEQGPSGRRAAHNVSDFGEIACARGDKRIERRLSRQGERGHAADGKGLRRSELFPTGKELSAEFGLDLGEL